MDDILRGVGNGPCVRGRGAQGYVPCLAGKAWGGGAPGLWKVRGQVGRSGLQKAGAGLAHALFLPQDTLLPPSGRLSQSIYKLQRPRGESCPSGRVCVQYATRVTVHCKPGGDTKKSWVTGALEGGAHGGGVDEAAAKWLLGLSTAVLRGSSLLRHHLLVSLPPVAVTRCQWEGTL